MTGTQFFSLAVLLSISGTFATRASGVNRKSNNVCDTFDGYEDIENSKHCWYDPDMDSTPEELVTRHGFQFSQHIVETEDHYRLTAFRIQDKAVTMEKGPILLQHGLSSNALIFLARGNRSLAFYLARNGYDVWLINIRGSYLNPEHAFLKETDFKFWDYSFHEVGVYDTPAIVQYIYEQTHQKVVYAGHSMGTAVGLIYAAEKREHSEEYLKSLLMLAVATDLKHISMELRNFMMYGKKLLDSINEPNFDVLFYNTNALRETGITACYKTFLTRLCIYALFPFIGDGSETLALESAPILTTFLPDRLSVQTAKHYLRNIQIQQFRKRDYGEERNSRKYNSTEPPLYPLEDITLPVHIFYAENDLLSVEKDSYETFHSLRESRGKSIQKVPSNSHVKYNHLDFVMAKNADVDIGGSVLDVIEK